MVVIRLSRGGSKKSPFYHVVATDKRSPRNGRFLERLGYYNPMARGQAVALHLQVERIRYWISQGAMPSARVAYLIDHYKAPAPAEKSVSAATSAQAEEK